MIPQPPKHHDCTRCPHMGKFAVYEESPCSICNLDDSADPKHDCQLTDDITEDDVPHLTDVSSMWEAIVARGVAKAILETLDNFPEYKPVLLAMLANPSANYSDLAEILGTNRKYIQRLCVRVAKLSPMLNLIQAIPSSSPQVRQQTKAGEARLDRLLGEPTHAADLKRANRMITYWRNRAERAENKEKPL